MGNITDDGTYENTSLTNPDDFSVTIVDNALYDDYPQEDPTESAKVPDTANPANLATPAENLYDDFSSEDPMEPANSASPTETPTESLDQLYAQVSKKSSKQQESLLDSPVDSQNNVYSEISPEGPSFYQDPETVVEFNNEMNERKLATKGGKEDDNCMGKLKFIIIGIFIGLIIVLVAIVCAIVLTGRCHSSLFLLPTGSEERGVLGAGSIPVAILPSCQDTLTFAF